MRAECRHCHRERKLYARGLCRPCWIRFRHTYPASRHPRPWTRKEQAFVLANYLRKGPQELARILGRSPASLSSAAYRLGVAPKRTAIADDPEKVERILKLRKSGVRHWEIAVILDCHENTVKSVVRKSRGAT